MKSRMWLIAIVIAATVISPAVTLELKGLNFLLQLISGEFMETKSKQSTEDTSAQRLGHAPPVTSYTFLDVVLYNKNRICVPSDLYDLQNNTTDKAGDDDRSSIKVKCNLGTSNGTMRIIESLQDIVTLLTPSANGTKRTQPGNCIVALFYTQSCPSSAALAPYFNALPRQFPDIQVAAIDAYKYHHLNTDLGIVGLPTIILFHQGRPIVKFNDTSHSINNLITFVSKHTGIHAAPKTIYVTSEDFSGPLSNVVVHLTDYYLYMAWLFIVACFMYHFTRSSLYQRIVEMAKINWRESAAQHERVLNL